MPPNVLPDAFIALLVYGILQLAKSLVTSMDRWPSNAVRAAGYGLTYAFVVVNRLVMGPVHWPDLWGMLPTAAALFGGSVLLYHVQDNAGGAGPKTSSSGSDTKEKEGASS